MQITRVVRLRSDVETARKKLLLAHPELKLHRTSSNMAWQLFGDHAGTVTAYSSGKIVVQSQQEDWVEDVATVLSGGITKLDVRNDSNEVFSPHVGVDEAGKGDFFGSLVIGAVFVETVEQQEKLVSIGVRDSKKLSDSMALSLCEKIRDVCPKTAEIIVSPPEYNRLYATVRNVNILLAQQHAQAVWEAIPKHERQMACPQVVVDQFSNDTSRISNAFKNRGLSCMITQMHHGERDIAVAAASVLARGGFLRELTTMGDRYGIKFPKGASHVIAFGKEFINVHGAAELENVAKISFKTSQSVLSSFDI